MKLHVFHETSYRYDQLIRRSIQMLRMTPPKTQRQHIQQWQLDLPGKATPWTDAFGNLCHCLVLENPTQDIVLRARGTVELNQTDQGEPEGAVPHTVFLRPTKLTSVDPAITAFIEPFRATVKSRPYMGLHDVMLALLERMPYETGITHVGDSASQSFAKGKGVCQDHTHVFWPALVTWVCLHAMSVDICILHTTSKWPAMPGRKRGWVHAGLATT